MPLAAIRTRSSSGRGSVSSTCSMVNGSNFWRATAAVICMTRSSGPQRGEPVGEHEPIAPDHAELERGAVVVAPELGAQRVAGENRPHEPRLDAGEPFGVIIQLAQHRMARDAEGRRTVQD